MVSTPASSNINRPLDAMATAVMVMLCLSWGFNQVATKLAIHDIPPLLQGAIRSIVAAFLVSGWCK
jgi:drug/metabolite transporter (DMT)-like permease